MLLRYICHNWLSGFHLFVPFVNQEALQAPVRPVRRRPSI